MRILLLTHYYAPEIGAPQRRWRELVEGLTAAGHQVAVAAPVPHYPHGRSAELGLAVVERLRWQDGEHGERVLRLPYLYSSASMVRQMASQVVSAAAGALVAAHMRHDPPDVVVSTTPGLPMIFAGEAAARALGVPHVAEIRDAWPDLVADSHLVASATKGALPKALTDRAERDWVPGLFTAAQKRADAVVVTTEGFATRLRERGVTNVHCVRATAAVDESAVHWRPTYTPGEGPLRLLYVGTVGRSQGLHRIVEAVKAVDGVELAIVGGGAAKPGLEAQVAGFPRITFRTQTVGQELDDLWAWAHSGVVSLDAVPAFEYTLPSKLYPLMAKGVHITGVLAGEASRVVTDTGAGHVVAPGDDRGLTDMIRSMKEGTLPVTQSPEALDWVRTHAAPQTAVDTYLDVLTGVVGSRSVGPGRTSGARA
ncbi:glycosyltransferase family 4 protein [Brevibacterium litoralis]|uniref:glycosyltransferase family 4 protein n=1 Tax=Brevibacterium litoralis TaxID=3138935 RepID=UPI0032EC666A